MSLAIRLSIEERTEIENDIPVIEVLFKLVQEVPSSLHLWVAIWVVRRGDTLCR